MAENWKDVLGYEGLYMVSDAGRVMRVDARQPRELLGESTHNGYRRVTLSSGRTRHVRVHRLVIETFVRTLGPNEQVNHKDGNRENNSLSNLEIVTPRENILHKFRVLKYKNPRRKLSDEQAQAIRSSSRSQKDLAFEYGVSPGCISHIRTNRTYKEVM